MSLLRRGLLLTDDYDETTVLSSQPICVGYRKTQLTTVPRIPSVHSDLQFNSSASGEPPVTSNEVRVFVTSVDFRRGDKTITRHTTVDNKIHYCRNKKIPVGLYMFIIDPVFFTPKTVDKDLKRNLRRKGKFKPCPEPN